MNFHYEYNWKYFEKIMLLPLCIIPRSLVYFLKLNSDQILKPLLISLPNEQLLADTISQSSVINQIRNPVPKFYLLAHGASCNILSRPASK